MAIAQFDVPLTLSNRADLDKALQIDRPILLYLSNGDTVRADVKTELEKVARENAGRIQVVKVEADKTPDIAERFEMGKYPLLIGWARGQVVGRRNRPWGTDIQGMIDVLQDYAPAAPVAATKPVIEKVDNKPVKVTDKTFEKEVMNSKVPVLVDFWADWCGPCKQIAPTLEKLAGEFAGKIRIAKVDVDANPGLQQAFHVQSIPTLMFVKNGKIVGQQAGALPEHTLRSAIQQLIALNV